MCDAVFVDFVPQGTEIEVQPGELAPVEFYVSGYVFPGNPCETTVTMTSTGGISPAPGENWSWPTITVSTFNPYHVVTAMDVPQGFQAGELAVSAVLTGLGNIVVKRMPVVPHECNCPLEQRTSAGPSGVERVILSREMTFPVPGALIVDNVGTDTCDYTFTEVIQTPGYPCLQSDPSCANRTVDVISAPLPSPGTFTLSPTDPAYSAAVQITLDSRALDSKQPSGGLALKVTAEDSAGILRPTTQYLYLKTPVIPDRETSSKVGSPCWDTVPPGNCDFKGNLVPGAADLKLENAELCFVGVTYSCAVGEAASGPPLDGCYFNNATSLMPWNHSCVSPFQLTGGGWEIDAQNTYQVDRVGFSEEAVNYYRGIVIPGSQIHAMINAHQCVAAPPLDPVDGCVVTAGQFMLYKIGMKSTTFPELEGYHTNALEITILPSSYRVCRWDGVSPGTQVCEEYP